MKSIETDFVVIGAGPAGSSCAYFLAKGGAKDVLLIDKYTLPRDKVCGDCIGPRAITCLHQMGLEEWLKDFYRINCLRLFAPDNSSVATYPPKDFSYPAKHACVVPRKILDHRLCQTALSAGARFCQIAAKLPLMDEQKVAGIVGVQDGKKVQVKAKLVIAADGSLRPFSTKITRQRVTFPAIALRAYFEDVQKIDDCINIFFKEYLHHGYAWVFPTSETTANVGVGVLLSQKLRSKFSLLHLFNRFIESQKNSEIADLGCANRISKMKGFPLQMNLEPSKLIADGALIIGDAAGLVNPLSGEGISFSLESGKLAAQVGLTALKEGDFSIHTLRNYAYALRQRYMLDWKMGHLLVSLMQYPPIMNRLVSKAAKHEELRNLVFGTMTSTIRPYNFFSPKTMLKLLS